MDFVELSSIIEAGKINLLGRGREQQKLYLEKLKGLKEKYENVSDSIKVRIFGFNEEEGEGGKLKAATPSEVGNRVVLRKNEFPYNFGSKIEHYVLWKLGSERLSKTEIEEAIEGLKKEEGVKRVAYWENTYALKSIRDLEHVQILCEVD